MESITHVWQNNIYARKGKKGDSSRRKIAYNGNIQKNMPLHSCMFIKYNFVLLHTHILINESKKIQQAHILQDLHRRILFKGTLI